MNMADLKETGKILIMLGGILGLIFGILKVMLIGGWGWASYGLIMGPLIDGIILILVSLIVLASSGVVKIPALEFANTANVMLILGFVMWIFGGDLGSMLVMAGAVLFFSK